MQLKYNSTNTCVDIDECSGTAHGCDHTNSPGSYTCDCNSGYRLIAADGRGCMLISTTILISGALVYCSSLGPQQKYVEY